MSQQPQQQQPPAQPATSGGGGQQPRYPAQQQPQQSQQHQQAYYHPSAGRGGQQAPPYVGGGGRGGGYNPQANRHYNNNNNNPRTGHQQQQQQNVPLGSWQPTQAGAYVVRGGAPGQPYNPAAAAYGGYPGAGAPVYNTAAAAAYSNPYPGAPGGSWQATSYHHPRGGGAAGGQTYYPPPPGASATSSSATTAAATATPAPPKKKMLTITDKHGNVIDLSSLGGNKNKKKTEASSTSAAAATTATTAATPSSSQATPATSAPSSNAGAKLRQMALERLEQDNAAAKQKQQAAAEKQKQEEEAAAAAQEKKAQEEAMAKLKAAAEEEAAKKKKAAEEAEAARKLAEVKAAEEAAALKKAQDEAAQAVRRIVLSKEDFLRFKSHDTCLEKIPTMPDMTIIKGPSRGGGRGRQNSQRDGNNTNNNSNDSWKRGNEPPRRQSKHDNSNNHSKDSWARGSTLPPPPKKDNRNNNNNNNNNKGGRGGRGGNNVPLYDGPVAPLVKSANHWRPKASTNALDVAEKQVKSILNKMTKEKFARLSQQMTEIPILSYETLTMMIENVYDKAIDEPSFGDIYADLCVKLSQAGSSSFIHIITSDEEPPTEGDADDDKKDVAQASRNTVYRWSNNVDVSDSEIVGPFSSEDECKAVAVDHTNDPSPIERGEMELELVSVSISQGMFIKVMKQKKPNEEDDKIYYTVYFPVLEAKECGQQLSDDIFLSEPEANADATKKNAFKRSLLNKCEEEFNKQDIYKDWKEEKAKYEASKTSLTEAERAEKEEEMDFRRIRIKKQMLGNIKFIGQLFKKNLLKEKIMRYCISTLLKLKEIEGVKSKNPEYEDTGDKDMDEEDHEAICSMFTTIGSTIDKPSSRNYVEVCFSKIADLSKDKALPSRSRFMYKDLLDLRKNNWVPRRKEEKAKTLDEIRKDVEREEQKQAEISQRENRQSYRGGGGRGGDFRQSGRQQSNRPRPKQVMETDDDGFTTISNPKGSGFGGNSRRGGPPGGPSAPPVATKASAFAVLADEGGASSSKASPGTKKAKPLSDEQLERRIKSIRSDFMGDGGNVDELRLSMDELSATPEAGLKMVQLNSDRMMDCKESERVAIIKILTICAEKKWISTDDFKNGLMDAIEFIDSIVMDAPKAFDYLAELLAGLLRIDVIDVAWICEQAEKTKADADTQAPSKLVKTTIAQLTKAAGAATAKSKFEGSSSAALSKLLGDDTWKAIAGELL